MFLTFYLTLNFWLGYLLSKIVDKKFQYWVIQLEDHSINEQYVHSSEVINRLLL